MELSDTWLRIRELVLTTEDKLLSLLPPNLIWSMC